MCWSLELLPNVLITGVAAQCADQWSYFPLCWSLVLLTTVSWSCRLDDGDVSVFSLCMMDWIISFCVLLDSLAL
jgi:hypothetical protein